MSIDAMTPKARFLAALERRTPDRLPVTTHHLMTSFLSGLDGGMTEEEFFERFGLDQIIWPHAVRPEAGSGAHAEPHRSPSGPEGSRLVSEEWRISETEMPHPVYRTVRYDFATPR